MEKQPNFLFATGHQDILKNDYPHQRFMAMFNDDQHRFVLNQNAESKILDQVATTKPKLKNSTAWLIAKHPLTLAIAAVTAGSAI